MIELTSIPFEYIPLAGGIIGQIAGMFLSEAMGNFFEEEPDLSAINNSTEASITHLQDSFDYLTKVGGGFDQKETIIEKKHEDKVKGVTTKFSNALSKTMDEGKQLIASTGFQGSGVAENKVDDMLETITSNYVSAQDTSLVAIEAEKHEFDISKYNTLSQLEKEMNQILGTYASTTGKTYETQGLAGLGSAMDQLTGG